MPVLTNDDPLGIGAFLAAYTASSNIQNQKQEQKRRTSEDQQTAAYQAAQEDISRKDLQLRAGEAGVDPNTFEPIRHAPLNMKPGLNPTDQEAAYRKASNDAFAAGDNAAATYYSHQADSLATDIYKQAETGRTNAQTANLRGLFAQQWKLAEAHFGNNLQVALMREQGAAQRAAMHAGRASAKKLGSMSADEKNNLYMLMALDRLQGGNDERAFSNAMRQQSEALQYWKAGEQSAGKGLTGDDLTQAQQTYEQQHPMPQLNVNVASPGQDPTMGAIQNLLLEHLGQQFGVPQAKPQAKPPASGGGGGAAWDGKSKPKIGQLYHGKDGKYYIWNGASWVPGS